MTDPRGVVPTPVVDEPSTIINLRSGADLREMLIKHIGKQGVINRANDRLRWYAKAILTVVVFQLGGAVFFGGWVLRHYVSDIVIETVERLDARRVMEGHK